MQKPVQVALRRSIKASAAILMTVAVISSNTQLASADTFTNNLLVAGDATITAGGSTTVGYHVAVQGTGADGQGGCNAADTTPLGVTITVPQGVTATSATFAPGTKKLTFVRCGAEAAQSVTFSSTTAKSNPGYHITHALSDAGSTTTVGTYVNSADFYLTVNAAPVTNSAPIVSVTSVVHGRAYEFGNVPAATDGCTAVDNEDGTVVFDASLSPITGTRSADGLGSQTAYCNYTDAGGKSASASATYSIVDTTPPAVTVPPNVTAEATSASGAIVTYSAASALDAVDGLITPTCTPASGATFALNTTTNPTTTVTCSATDKAGLTGSKTFAVKVQDTTKPVVDVPANITEGATSSSGAKVSFTVTASDAVTSPLAATCDKTSGDTFPLGTTTVNCSAKDGAGNIGTNSFDIKVQDLAKPEVTVPDDIVAEATSASGAVVEYTGASALDAVDGTITPTCTPASGATFALNTTTNPTTTVTCSATDKAGNTGTNAFTITVKDTTAPAVIVPDPIVAEATSALGAPVSFSVSATDAVSGSPKVKCTRGTGLGSTVVSGDTFALTETLVNCSATDAAGNTGTKTFTVKVQDTIKPVVTAPADIVEEATSASGAPVEYTIADATDAVSGPIVPTCTKASGSVFPLGETTVTCTAKDSSDNEGTDSFKVTVRDTTKPVVTPPGNVTKEATSGSGALVSYGLASATDAVTPNLNTTCSPASGSQFVLGETTVTCSATDAATNTGTATFTVTVQDTTKPVVTVPADITEEATSALGSVVSYMGVSASDLVDGVLGATCDKASGITYPLGITTVTCSAIDNAKNTGTNTFTITVQDKTPPVVSVPANITATATSTAGAVVTFGGASAIDTVSGALPADCDVDSGSTFAPGVTTVSCTAVDGAGNVGAKSFTVTVTYAWSNFLQPINTDGSSIFKLGSTVPVKFKLTGASAGITNLVAQLSYRKVTNGVLGTQVEATSTAAADSGNTFRYDATAGQYIFNLSSKAITGGDGTYELQVVSGDVVLGTVRISFRK